MVNPRKERYIPERGDIIWIDFDSYAGHEQAGRRPAVVLSPAKYNRQTELLLVCPITSKQKGYPFEVKIEGEQIHGVALADQLRSFDWRARKGAFVERLDYAIVQKIQKRAVALIFM